MPEEDKTTTKPKIEKIIAKRNFLIVQNDSRYDIKEGDDIVELKIPKRFYENLKTEKVI